MEKTKLSLLDKCIDGDKAKFDELLTDAFDNFNVFFELCKNVKEITETAFKHASYSGMREGRAEFNIRSSSLEFDNDGAIRLLNKAVEIPNEVYFTRTSKGVKVHILVKE